MDEVAVAEKPKRRRKSRSSRKEAGSWGAYFRGPSFGRHLFVFMCLIGVAYAGKIAWETRVATYFYNSLTVGSSEGDVRYMLGPPRSTEQNGRIYRYEERGALVTVRFGADGSMESITCSPLKPEYAGRCGPILGIRIGEIEDNVVVRLGAPTRQSYVGDDKLMHYDGLGVTFHMRRYRVYALEVHKGASLAGYLPRIFWRMLP
jgi:hypothetical protein